VENRYEDLAPKATDVQSAAFKEQKKKDCKALFYIHQNVDSNHFEKISKITSVTPYFYLSDKTRE
jgi:hypothetical protein